MPVLPLKTLATRMCIRNVKGIDDIGGLSYEICRPFLLKVDNPDQLRQLELSEPSICGDDAELWISFIKRDCPGSNAHLTGPKNPKNWYKVYRKAMQDDQKRVNEQSAILQAAFDRQVAQKNEQQTTMLKGTIGPKPKKRPFSSAFASGASGTRTKVVGGRSLLERARREAREAQTLRKQAKSKNGPDPEPGQQDPQRRPLPRAAPAPTTSSSTLNGASSSRAPQPGVARTNPTAAPAGPRIPPRGPGRVVPVNQQPAKTSLSSQRSTPGIRPATTISSSRRVP